MMVRVFGVRERSERALFLCFDTGFRSMCFGCVGRFDLGSRGMFVGITATVVLLDLWNDRGSGSYGGEGRIEYGEEIDNSERA